MERGLTITIVYFDADDYQLRVTANNGDFSGNVSLYVAIGYLAELAGELEGFPRTSGDEQKIELGTFDPGYAGGGVRAHLRCTDGAGHIRMQLHMVTDQDDPSQSVSLVLPVEPASIDRFVEELRLLEKDRTGEPALRSYI